MKRLCCSALLVLAAVAFWESGWPWLTAVMAVIILAGWVSGIGCIETACKVLYFPLYLPLVWIRYRRMVRAERRLREPEVHYYFWD